MRRGFLRTAGALAVVTMLSACNDVALTGQVLSPTPSGAWACLDGNGDSRCDDTEPGAPVMSDGTFVLQRPAIMVPLALNVLVQVPSQAATEPAAGPLDDGAVTLAAPAHDDGVWLTGLSTLLAMHRAGAGEQGEPTDGASAPEEPEALAAVEAALKQTLRWGADASFTADLREAAHASLARLDAMVLSALHKAVAAQRARDGSDAFQVGLATREAARALAPIIGRYTDASSGQLFHTVGERTVVGETVATFAPHTCVTQPPPLVVIDTAGGAPILDRETYIPAQLTMAATEAFPQALNLSTRIRGRGNSTWNLEKKPYRLKLDNKAALLGMTSDKDWALLANHTDKTMLRNAVAFCLGKAMGMAYTPTAHHVELRLNNDDLGLYQLVEHVKVADHRVRIGALASGADDPAAGFLLEIDARLDETHWFYGQRGMPYTVKSEVTDPAQVGHIQAVVRAMEAALFGEGFEDPASGYAAHLDVEALVDFYLINEYLRNNDAFYSSTYVTRERGGKLMFGPLWDFDLAAGNVKFFDNRSPTGWWLRDPTHYHGMYIRRLFEDPVFERHVQARWQHLKRQLPGLQAYIRQSASTLAGSQARNFQRWDILNTPISPSPLALGSHAAEVAHLRDWLDQRATWMDEQFAGGTQAEAH